MDHHPHLQMSPWEAAATGHTDVLSAMLVHDEQDLCSIRDYQVRRNLHRWKHGSLGREWRLTNTYSSPRLLPG